MKNEPTTELDPKLVNEALEDVCRERDLVQAKLDDKLINISADVVCAFSARLVEVEKNRMRDTVGGIAPGHPAGSLLGLSTLERELYALAIDRLRRALRLPDPETWEVEAGLRSKTEVAS